MSEASRNNAPDLRIPSAEGVTFFDRVAALERDCAQMRTALVTILKIVDPPIEGAVEMTSRKKPTYEELAEEREAMAQDLDDIMVACWEGLADD